MQINWKTTGFEFPFAAEIKLIITLMHINTKFPYEYDNLNDLSWTNDDYNDRFEWRKTTKQQIKHRCNEMRILYHIASLFERNADKAKKLLHAIVFVWMHWTWFALIRLHFRRCIVRMTMKGPHIWFAVFKCFHGIRFAGVHSVKANGNSDVRVVSHFKIQNLIKPAC